MQRAIPMILAALLLAGLAEGGKMLEPTDTFPAFELAAHDGSVVRSEDLAGTAYLLYFYPKANTPGCTKEACAFRDSWEDVTAAGLTVLGVSYDSPDSNRRFAETYHLPFLLLSDTDHRLAKAVGASRALLPFPKRISYLVGSDGRVVRSYAEVNPSTHAAQVLADARAEGLAPAPPGS
ncbi:MAG: peroxiredoxin [Acidobacteria bacterium]|nr:peroxiredoxin [Acidobacteriota bacterium]